MAATMRLLLALGIWVLASIVAALLRGAYLYHKYGPPEIPSSPSHSD